MAAGEETGLPEIGLGILPGAGGTRRLSRLLGLALHARVRAIAPRLIERAGLRPRPWWPVRGPPEAPAYSG